MSAATNARTVHLGRIARVEALLPGYRVIAGPFNIATLDVPLRRREIRECAAAKAQQLAAGVDAKCLLLRDGAWVLRDGKGWQVMTGGASSGEVRSLAKERELARNRDLRGRKIRNGKGATR